MFLTLLLLPRPPQSDLLRHMRPVLMKISLSRLNIGKDMLSVVGQVLGIMLACTCQPKIPELPFRYRSNYAFAFQCCIDQDRRLIPDPLEHGLATSSVPQAIFPGTAILL